MYTARDFIAVDNLEEAYRLMQESNKNRLLAGGMWLRLGKGKYGSLIDISKVGLNYIKAEPQNGDIRIGALTDLRSIEASPILQANFAGFFPLCLENIVGVQFRNLATIGGNIYCCHGFSDIIPCLLTLNCYLNFYKNGIISLADYIERYNTKGRLQDILTELILPAKAEACSFTAFKHTATDFSALNFAAAVVGKDLRIAIGARPSTARLWLGQLALGDLPKFDLQLAKKICNCYHFGTNLRAGEAYRKEIAPHLLLETIGHLKSKLI